LDLTSLYQPKLVVYAQNKLHSRYSNKFRS
jgi:hypothetical protein